MDEREATYGYYKKRPLFEKWDIAVAIILLLALIAMLLVIFLPNQGKTVEVYKNGQLVASYPLDENRAFEVGNIRIEIFEGAVKVAESDCPDKLCVHSSAISASGSTIICVPNKVVIKITGKAEVEGVTQ
jgi:hypothetical protein